VGTVHTWMRGACACTWAHAHTHSQAHTRTHTRTQACAYLNMRVHTRTHRHIHARVHQHGKRFQCSGFNMRSALPLSSGCMEQLCAAAEMVLLRLPSFQALCCPQLQGSRTAARTRLWGGRALCACTYVGLYTSACAYVGPSCWEALPSFLAAV